MTRLELLLGVHSHFVDAAKLPEGVRPYSAQSRLDLIGKSIMEELEKQNLKRPEPTKNDDDIPF